VDTVYDPAAVTRSFQSSGAASRFLSLVLRRE
jgi:hypothetical protein